MLLVICCGFGGFFSQVAGLGQPGWARDCSQVSWTSGWRQTRCWRWAWELVSYLWKGILNLSWHLKSEGYVSFGNYAHLQQVVANISPYFWHSQYESLAWQGLDVYGQASFSEGYLNYEQVNTFSAFGYCFQKEYFFSYNVLIWVHFWNCCSYLFLQSTRLYDSSRVLYVCHVCLWVNGILYHYIVTLKSLLPSFYLLAQSLLSFLMRYCIFTYVNFVQ